MKQFIQVTFLIIATLMNSQDNGVCIKGPRFEAGEWVLTGGKSITEESFMFEKFNKTKHKTISEIFTFTKDGKVTYRLYNPEPLGMCGNGMLYLKSGTWSIKDDVVNLELEGGRIAESTFSIKGKYKVTMTGWETAAFKKL